ncbi:zinc finger protein 276 [Discoglossus pictus]
MKRERGGGRRGGLKRRRGENGAVGELGAAEHEGGPLPCDMEEERAGIKKTLSAGYCRLCHGKFSTRSLHHAFGKVPVTGPTEAKQKRLDQVFFADFQQLVGVSVQQDPELPQFVCKDCHSQFYKCRGVLRTFIQRVNTSPTDPHNKKIGKICSSVDGSTDHSSDLITSSPECLHDLVSWTHGHAGSCPSVPNLQKVLSKQYFGIIRAVWRCGGGHDYIMDTDPDCSLSIKQEPEKIDVQKRSSKRTHGIRAKPVTAPSGYSIPDRTDTTPPLPDTGGAGSHSPQSRSPALPLDAQVSPENDQSSPVDTPLSSEDPQASVVESQTSHEDLQASIVDPQSSPESPQASAVNTQSSALDTHDYALGPLATAVNTHQSAGDPQASIMEHQSPAGATRGSPRGARGSSRGSSRGARGSSRGSSRGARGSSRGSSRGARGSSRTGRGLSRAASVSARGDSASARGRGTRTSSRGTRGSTRSSIISTRIAQASSVETQDSHMDTRASAVDIQESPLDAEDSQCPAPEATNGQDRSDPTIPSDDIAQDGCSDHSNRAFHSDVEEDDCGAASSDDSFKPYTEKRASPKKSEPERQRPPRKQKKPRKIKTQPEPKERKKPGPKPGFKRKKGEWEELPTIYKCHHPGCSAVYRGADGMKKHIKEHHEEVRERPCPHPGCNKVFMIDRYLQRHIKLIHTEERNYICDQCGQAFKQRKHLTVHQLRHTGAKPLQDIQSDAGDDNCDDELSSDDSVVLYPVEPRSPQEEDVPDQTKKRKGPKVRLKPGPKPGFRKKIKEEQEELPKIYRCHYAGCSAVYSCAVPMMKHIKDLHEDVREHPCPHPSCNKVFMIDRYLQRHVKLIHTEERKFICDQCGQAFKQRKHLDVHQLRHTGAKPLQCEICGFQCRQRASLKFHMTKHKSEADLEFACKKCGKRFEKAHNLSVHMSMIHPLINSEKKEIKRPSGTKKRRTAGKQSLIAEAQNVDIPSTTLVEQVMEASTGTVDGQAVVDSSAKVVGQSESKTVGEQAIEAPSGIVEEQTMHVPSATVVGQVMEVLSGTVVGQTMEFPSETLIGQPMEAPSGTEIGQILEAPLETEEREIVLATLETVEGLMMEDPSDSGETAEAPSGTIQGQIVEALSKPCETQTVEVPTETVEEQLMNPELVQKTL